MTTPLEHIRKHPQLAKQLIGLTLPQLEQLIKKAIAKNKERKKEEEEQKIRLNKKGAGRAKNLSEEVEICLTLFYLRGCLKSQNKCDRASVKRKTLATLNLSIDK